MTILIRFHHVQNAQIRPSPSDNQTLKTELEDRKLIPVTILFILCCNRLSFSTFQNPIKITYQKTLSPPQPQARFSASCLKPRRNTRYSAVGVPANCSFHSRQFFTFHKCRNFNFSPNPAGCST